MAKEVEVNNDAAQDQERQRQQPSGGKHNQQKLQGKSLQINKNSVEDQQPSRSAAAAQQRQAGDKHNQQKLQGKSLQINKNGVED